MIGKLDEVSDLLNYILIVAKWHIWMSRKRSLTPDIAAFKEVINMKYKTEKYIAVKNNAQRNFRPDGKYLLISNYDLLYQRLNYCFYQLIMLLTLINGVVFCKLPVEIKMWKRKSQTGD